MTRLGPFLKEPGGFQMADRLGSHSEYLPCLAVAHSLKRAICLLFALHLWNRPKVTLFTFNFVSMREISGTN